MIKRVVAAGFLLGFLHGAGMPVGAQVSFGPLTKLSHIPAGAEAQQWDYLQAAATDRAGIWAVFWAHSEKVFIHPGPPSSATFHTIGPMLTRSTDNGVTWLSAEVPSVLTGMRVYRLGGGAGTWIAACLLDNGDFAVARSADAGATWTAPIWLGGGAGHYGYGADVATDGGGNWIVTWSAVANTSGGQRYQVVASRSSDNGLTWSQPAPLTAGLGPVDHEIQPRIETDSAGAWVAVWTTCTAPPQAPFCPTPTPGPGPALTPCGDVGLVQWGQSSCSVSVARSTDGGATWTAPIEVNGAFVYRSYWPYPRVATDRNGHWAITWHSSFVETDEDILLVRSNDAGASWTDPAFLNTTAASDGSDQQDQSPSLAMDGTGLWLAGWFSSGVPNSAYGYATEVATSTDDGGTWSVPGTLPTVASSGDGLQVPEVISDGAGHWIVAGETLGDALEIAIIRGSSWGNGVVEYDKQCDDGNRIDGDGCSSTCQNELLAGDNLLLKGPPASTGDMKLSVVSRDATIRLGRGNGSVDDPLRAGATLQVMSSATDVAVTYNLPAAYWRYVGKQGKNKGYIYRDSAHQAGPITRVAIQAGHALRISGKGTGAGMRLSLALNPDPIGVVLNTGPRTYTLEFGGQTAFTNGKMYKAKQAPAPRHALP